MSKEVVIEDKRDVLKKRRISKLPMGRRRFTDDEIISMRERTSAGKATRNELAKEYNISVFSIDSIVKGRTYASVGGPILDKDLRRSAKRSNSLHDLVNDDRMNETERLVQFHLAEYEKHKKILEGLQTIRNALQQLPF